MCVGPDGRPVFNQLLYRRGYPYFYAFDILWLNGCDLRNLPLVQRKQELRRLIPKQLFPVLYTDHEDGHGAQLYEAACSLDLEGIGAKWKYAPYVGDDVATSWVKIKNPAYSQAQGRHEHSLNSDGYPCRDPAAMLSTGSSASPAPGIPVLKAWLMGTSRRSIGSSPLTGRRADQPPTLAGKTTYPSSVV